jgi:hypothetical protein
MGRETAIEWTHHTFNPWHGCDAAPRRFFGDNHWREPLRWDVEARAAGVAWARDIMAQCAFACVPVFVKQMGARPVGAVLDVVRLDRKGGDPSEWPPDLRVRQLPGTA